MILFFCSSFVVFCRLSCDILQKSLTDWMKQSTELCSSLGLNFNPNLADHWRTFRDNFGRRSSIVWPSVTPEQIFKYTPPPLTPLPPDEQALCNVLLLPKTILPVRHLDWLLPNGSCQTPDTHKLQRCCSFGGQLCWSFLEHETHHKPF